MEITFADNDLMRLAADDTYSGGYARELVKAYRKVIGHILRATDERDLYAPRSYRFEKLKGSRQHQRSLRLNDQWRLIIELDESRTVKVVVVCAIEDYH